MVQIKSRYRRLLTLLRFSSNALHEYGFRFFISSAFIELKKYGLHVFSPEPESVKVRPISEESAYMSWLHNHHVTPEIASTMRMMVQTYTNKPKLTIIFSVNEKNKQYLKESFFSIINQTYTNWEMCLSSATPISKEIDEMLYAIPESDISIKPKIRYTDSLKNALLHSGGDFIAFVNCGNVLTSDALFRIIQLLNKNPDADIIYSDEDQITKAAERKNPFFKPDWSPYLFLSLDYISNFYIVKKKILDGIIIPNAQYEQIDHYDLLLRLTEKTEKIFHIPTVLVSVRATNDLKSETNFEKNAQVAISDALTRRGVKGTVEPGLVPKTFRVSYRVDKEPKVTIIIPTKDNKDLLNRCITSIKKKTSYKNYEIIIIDNGSTKEETISYLKSLPHTIIKYEHPFNFSKMNNLAVSRATGDYLLFLNDDAAPLEPNWLSEMVSICVLDKIGIVGAKLVHGNNTIQHAGISLLKTGAGFHPLQGIDSKSSGYFGLLNVIRDCSAVTGACLLVKKKIFEQIGGFDNNFDLYYGDTDLCLTVRKHGYGVVYTPYAKLLHQGSRTIKEYATAFFTVENYCHFIKKWPVLKNGDPFYNPNLGWDYHINIEEDVPIENEFAPYRPKMKEETRKIINELYMELLLRPIDEQGLLYYGSLLESGNITKEGLRKMILESDEVKNIQKFSHYTSEYWNNLDEVQQYLNELSTGDKKTDWMKDMKIRFKQYLPFKKVLIVGCGNGWVERLLFDLGIGLEFDAFDASEEYIEVAKKEKGDRPINYFVSDVNNMENIEDSKYDAIFNYAILHHTTEIEYAMKKLSKVLNSNGLMFNWEYVGPSRNQYTNEHLRIMEEVMHRLPKRLQSEHSLRPALENFRVEPTEAIHSDLVRPMFEKYFDVIYERDLNGGIAYQILWNNIGGFKDKSDKEAAAALKMLLSEDRELSRTKKVPVLFWYGIGKPRKLN